MADLFMIDKEILKTEGISTLAKLILQRMINLQYSQCSDYPTCSLEYLESFFGTKEKFVINGLNELLREEFLTDYIGFRKVKGTMVYKWGLNYEKLNSTYGYGLPFTR